MFKKKDQELLAEAYRVIQTEGFMSNIFKKKPSQQDQQPISNVRGLRHGRTVKVNVFGKPQEFSVENLIQQASKDIVKSISGGGNSGTIESILGIYKTFKSNDPSGYGHDVDIFIPVAWYEDDNADYPRSPIAFRQAGKEAFQSRDEAIQAGMEILKS